MRYILVAVLLVFGLTSCSTTPKYRGAEPGGYKVGNPYKVEGKTYAPKEEPAYDKVGMASWYGPNFHGKRTANGEIYNQKDITAAHKTLPLPSMVRVTNLENGRTLIVRVNDRGPYSSGRIIDVSERAAELLGFKQKGTAEVRVQFLPGQSREMLSERAKETGFKSLADAADRLAAYDDSGMKQDAEIVVETLAANEERPYYPNATFLKENARASQSAKMKTEPFEGSAYEKDAPVVVEEGASESELDAAVVATEEPSPSGLYVQAGAFSVKDNASRMAHSLLSFGETVVSPSSGSHGTLYRVRLGPIDSRTAAEDLLAKVKASGYSGALIIEE